MWLFRVLVFRVLRLLLPAVPFCPLFLRFRVRLVLAVLRVLIVLSALLFRLLRCSVFSRLCPVLLLLPVLPVWFIGLLPVVVCLWLFPLGACPSGVAVSSSFRGCGSGSWGSVALALGLGCSVLVVCPVGVGSAWFGVLASCFRPVGSAPCGGSLWLTSSAPVQFALF